MQIRFSMGEIRRLLIYFNMKPLRKDSFIYGGMEKAEFIVLANLITTRMMKC